MDNLEKAMLLASNAHADQKYGGLPYHYHLKQVVKTSIRMGYPEKIQVACALHDVLEDTDVPYSMIKRAFGKEVAEIVYDVTDELGRNRRERKRKTYSKTAKNVDAVAVKLCDRISNLNHSFSSDESILDMYISEHDEFKQKLYRINDKYNQKAWEELDELIEKCNKK